MNGLQRVELGEGADLDGFRRAVRRLAGRSVPPEAVAWTTAAAPTLFPTIHEEAAEAPALILPRAVAALVELAACHRDPERWGLLYTLIWRVLHGERALLEVASDPLVHRLELMAKTVRRDLHKMHAFLRFRRVDRPEGEEFVAWFEPEHFIVEAAADFFVDRFRALVWTILTPLGSLHWDRRTLQVGGPARREEAPTEDAFEAGWRGYYESVFNPARLNPQAMRAQMPRKYWRNLPEAASIPALVQAAPQRVTAMMEREAAMPQRRAPEKALAAMADQDPKSLAELNRLIRTSEPLVPGATQAVLGEGPEGAAIAFVGEQPGDQEDLQGRPFVGPAGQLLDRALEQAGVDRSAVYVTNAVKHFKFQLRGKKRIHQKPTVGEVKHYRWWLMKELDFVRPRITVALGSTAVTALAGKPLPVTRHRGPASFDGRPGYITVHPSYLLRIPDAAAKVGAWRDFVADLERIRELADGQGRPDARRASA